MMTIGENKGKILDDTVKEIQPMVALELGTYCGYSTVRIRRHMPKGSVLITLDVN
jgi:catechol O-methyltransferase